MSAWDTIMRSYEEMFRSIGIVTAEDSCKIFLIIFHHGSACSTRNTMSPFEMIDEIRAWDDLQLAWKSSGRLGRTPKHVEHAATEHTRISTSLISERFTVPRESSVVWIVAI